MEKNNDSNDEASTKCRYGIPRTEWTDKSAAPRNGVHNMTIKSYRYYVINKWRHCHPMY